MASRCRFCGRLASEDHVCSLGSATIPDSRAEIERLRNGSEEGIFTKGYFVGSPMLVERPDLRDPPVRRRWPWRKRR